MTLRQRCDHFNALHSSISAQGINPYFRPIAKTWGTTEGLAYLKHLLRDTRNGQRTGFPLSIAREILFLLDLLETRLHTKA